MTLETPAILLSKEAHAAAAELQIILEESPELAAIVEDMLNLNSLPPPWTVTFDAAKGRREYRNRDTGEVAFEHPLVGYYRGAAFMKRGGYEEMKELETKQPPSEDEVAEMAAYLHVNMDEDPYVLEVVMMAISAPLPHGWTESEDQNGNMVYINSGLGEAVAAHPLDDYFLELIRRRRYELKVRDPGVGIRSKVAEAAVARVSTAAGSRKRLSHTASASFAKSPQREAAKSAAEKTSGGDEGDDDATDLANGIQEIDSDEDFYSDDFEGMEDLMRELQDQQSPRPPEPTSTSSEPAAEPTPTPQLSTDPEHAQSPRAAAVLENAQSFSTSTVPEHAQFAAAASRPASRRPVPSKSATSLGASGPSNQDPKQGAQGGGARVSGSGAVKKVPEGQVFGTKDGKLFRKITPLDLHVIMDGGPGPNGSAVSPSQASLLDRPADSFLQPNTGQTAATAAAAAGMKGATANATTAASRPQSKASYAAIVSESAAQGVSLSPPSPQLPTDLPYSTGLSPPSSRLSSRQVLSSIGAEFQAEPEGSKPSTPLLRLPSFDLMSEPSLSPSVSRVGTPAQTHPPKSTLSTSDPPSILSTENPRLLPHPFSEAASNYPGQSTEHVNMVLPQSVSAPPHLYTSLAAVADQDSAEPRDYLPSIPPSPSSRNSTPLLSPSLMSRCVSKRTSDFGSMFEPLGLDLVDERVGTPSDPGKAREPSRQGQLADRFASRPGSSLSGLERATSTSTCSPQRSHRASALPLDNLKVLERRGNSMLPPSRPASSGSAAQSLPRSPGIGRTTSYPSQGSMGNPPLLGQSSTHSSQYSASMQTPQGLSLLNRQSLTTPVSADQSMALPSNHLSPIPPVLERPTSNCSSPAPRSPSFSSRSGNEALHVSPLNPASSGMTAHERTPSSQSNRPERLVISSPQGEKAAYERPNSGVSFQPPASPPVSERLPNSRGSPYSHPSPKSPEHLDQPPHSVPHSPSLSDRAGSVPHSPSLSDRAGSVPHSPSLRTPAYSERPGSVSPYARSNSPVETEVPESPISFHTPKTPDALSHHPGSPVFRQPAPIDLLGSQAAPSTFFSPSRTSTMHRRSRSVTPPLPDVLEPTPEVAELRRAPSVPGSTVPSPHVSGSIDFSSNPLLPPLRGHHRAPPQSAHHSSLTLEAISNLKVRVIRALPSRAVKIVKEAQKEAKKGSSTVALLRRYGSMTEIELGLMSDAVRLRADALMLEASHAVAEDVEVPAAVSAPKVLREAIRVVARVRPLFKAGEEVAWNILTSQRGLKLRGDLPATSRHTKLDKVFKYDALLGPEASNQTLFQGHIQPLLDSTLAGINCTVFAYGQTGSGKTYTMFGSPSEWGTVPTSLAYLFSQMTARRAGERPLHYRMRMGMLELYNEELRDLLVPSGERLARGIQALKIMDDMHRGVVVMGLHEEVVHDLKTSLELLDHGNAIRSVGATALNEVSSRSHTIVRLQLETRDGLSGILKHTSTISFVDLAGSERLSKTGATGTRFQEGTNINLSLLCLGTVVASLADGRRGDFVPYRNSKLTRLLQPCLGGNSRTIIVAALNPGVTHIEESINTLLFAQRAMAVVNQVKANPGEDPNSAATNYRLIIRRLKAQLKRLQSGVVEEKVAELEARVEQLVKEKEHLMDALEGITGTPQGSVLDNISHPIAPIDLGLSPARPIRNAGVAPEKALRSIARVVMLGRKVGGRAGGGVAGLDGAGMAPEEVVMAVREMRAERDELRRRDEKWRTQMEGLKSQVSQLEPLSKDHAIMHECVSILENLLGPCGSPDDPAPDRLRDAVNDVVLLSRELGSLQRQLHTSELLAAKARQRADAAESSAAGALQMVTGAAPADVQQLLGDMERQIVALREESEEVRAQLHAWRGFAAAETASGESGTEDMVTGPAGAPQQVWPSPVQAVAMGSYAVKMARAARAEERKVSAQLAKVVEERDELQAKILALESAGAELLGANEGYSQWDEPGLPEKSKFEKLRNSLQALTKEVAALTKERDAMIGIVLAQTNGTYSLPHDIITHVFSTVPKEAASPLSLESILGPAQARSKLALGALHNAGIVSSNGGGGGSNTIGNSPLGAAELDLVALAKGAKAKSFTAGGPERGEFNIRPIGLEVQGRMQRQADRANRLSSDPVAQVPWAEPRTGATKAEGEVSNLRRKVVLLERQKTELIAKSAAELRATQLQMAATTRAAHAEAKAHGEQVKQICRTKEEEIAAVKADASRVILQLMEENARLKAVLPSAAALAGMQAPAVKVQRGRQ